MATNLGILTQADLNEAMKLEKRKQYEDQRKKRIFNAKQRLYGIDLDALERQIAEKTKQRHFEAECVRRYEQQTQMMQDAVKAKELELEKRKHIMESDLNYYRCRYQRKEQRREFDLNDPNWNKKSQPIRIADDDINLGISSAQIFLGEDLGFKERKQRQRAQQRAWLDQQVMERKHAEESRVKADRILQESLHSRDKRLEDMANSERRVRHEIVDSIRRFNGEMAKRKTEERARKKKETTEDDMAEIYNMLTSDMLTENPDVAQSKTNPNKKIAFMFRGMTPEELAQFRKQQHQQMLEGKRRRTEEQLMDKQWEQYALNIDRELMLKHLEMERKKQAELQQLIEFNGKLAKEQKTQREYNNKIMNINRVSKEFYEQFNKTTR
uniref:RIB43A-like with coiled-coils protein 2 n=1 Tax=Glossina morsitans morsitans TaxID=37546 RepID=A0A1B0GDC5_GLOMM